MLKVLGGLAVLGMLSACAQQPVSMSNAFWSDTSDSIAIVIVKPPVASTHQQGSQGLLDVAISSGASSSLNDHLKTLSFAEFDGIGNDLQARLKARGLNVVGVYTEYQLPALQPMPTRTSQAASGPKKVYAQQDYRPLAATLKADRVLLITPTAIGTVRSYYGFIPLGAPQGTFITDDEIVDLKTDELLWFHTSMSNTAIATPWDEAPDFPNLTDAVYQAMNADRADILQQFPPAANDTPAPAAVAGKL